MKSYLNERRKKMSNLTGREPGFNTEKGLKGFQTAVPVAPPAPTANPLAETRTPIVFHPESGTLDAQMLAALDKFKDAMAPRTAEEEAQVAELSDIVERQNAGENVTFFGDGEIPSGNRNRKTFEKYSSFKPEILALTDALFKARPSTLTQEARAEVYQKWVNDASVVYGLPGAPEIVWGTTGNASYNQEANVLQLNSEKPYINKLLKGFRLMQLALGNATTLPSLTEREYTRDEYTYLDCACGEEWEGIDSVCPECFSPGEERIDEYRLPGNVRNRNYNNDANAWSESLYYKSRPVLFKKKAQEGGFGRHARNYFPALVADDTESLD